jgi:quercetin dioxygenase-like cupin family protein
LPNAHVKYDAIVCSVAPTDPAERRAANDADLRRQLAGEGLTASSWSNGPGDRYGVHRHDYDKVLVAAAGSITFELPDLGERIELEVGDRLELPAGTAHGAVVGPQGVTCLEAHLAAGSLAGRPVRQVAWATSRRSLGPETASHGSA